MDDITLEEQELDGEQATSELADDSQNYSTGDDTNPEHKNKSNWKNLSKAKKDLERKLSEKDKVLAEKDKVIDSYKSEVEQLKEWANSLYWDWEEKPFTKKEAKEALEDVTSRESPEDVFIFYQKNAEAIEYKDEIVQTMKDYKVDRDKAWKIVKVDIPVESKSKNDFNLSSKTPKLPKDLTKVKIEDTKDWTPKERSEWRKANWFAED